LLHLAHEVIYALEIRIPACALESNQKAEDVLRNAGLGECAPQVIESFETEFGALRGFF